jgi:branched-chain amino acid transport system ATP-binding protein
MELTVHENLRVGRGSIDRATELFPELIDHLKRRAGDLSGGQQQMLSLARVMAANPDVLVADELSLGLAPTIVKRLISTLVDAASNGTAVLIVEQHAELALETASRAYVMRRGRIVLEGLAAEFQDRYDELQRLYLGRDVDENEDAITAD